MEKRKYDLVMSVGTVCACSQALRAAGLQYASFPFDWNGGNGLRLKVGMMVRDFEGWLKQDALRLEKSSEPGVEDYWRDDNGFRFLHDFTSAAGLDEQLPGVRAKYRRRINRMNALICRAGRVLLVYMETPFFPKTTAEECACCRRMLVERWPDVTFDFLNLKYREGVGFADRVEREEAGVRVVEFDYRDPKERTWRIDYRRIGKWLAAEYEAVDYRTEAEKEAWHKTVAGHEYGRFHVTNFWDYLYTKFRYKLYRHLVKILQRKGVI